MLSSQTFEVVTGVLVQHPHKQVRKWAILSALLSLMFYSTQLVEVSLELQPTFIASVLVFSVLPFACLHVGIKYQYDSLLELYKVVQLISTLCNILQLVLLYIYTGKFNRICTDCTFDQLNNTCLFTEEQQDFMITKEDCSSISTSSVTYSILYIAMSCANIKAFLSLQACKQTMVVISSDVSEV